MAKASIQTVTMAQASSSRASTSAVTQPQSGSRPRTESPDLEMSRLRLPGEQETIDDHIPREKKRPSLYDDNFEKFPIGWPRFSREQNLLHNGSIHRRFGYLFQRTLYCLEQRISALEIELINLENQPAGEDDRANQSIRQKTYQHLDKIEPLLDRYASLLCRDKELRALAPVTRKEHYNIYKAIHNSKMLGEKDCFFMEAGDDFISTRAERTYYPIQWLLYGRANPAIQKFLFRNKKASETIQGAFDTYYSSDIMKLVWKVSVAVLCGILLLAPIFILYLVSLTKAKSAGVVVAFAFVFSIVLSLVSALKIDTILVGLSAYLAVLVTFLANLSSGENAS